MQVGLGPAKGKDFATSIGPWIVTADELPSLDLDCRVSVNGVHVGGDRLSNMHWTFPEMIAYASRDSVVLPGDLLASGTTGGGGLPRRALGSVGVADPAAARARRRRTMEVSGIGTLSGSVA